MDVTLGPFKNAMATHVANLDGLVAAMHDQAFQTAKDLTFDGIEPVGGKPAAKGFTISGKITSVAKDSGNTIVTAAFTIWVDGTFSNASMPPAHASGQGSPAEDIVKALTESAVTKALKAIKAGQVRKAS